MKKKLRVIVCGTSFGRFYIQGIKRYSEHYHLIGILSRGSMQSKELAEQEGVKLYTSSSEITREMVDVVCIVVRSNIVGGNGTELAEEFLRKGIHVVQEQPVHYTDMMKCYKWARQNKCQYFVESFYPYLETTNKYIEMAHSLLSKTTAVYLETACSIQVLYPMLDVVGRLLGGFTPWFVEKEKTIDNGIFTEICGKVKGVSWSLKVQNELNSENPDNYFYLLQKITLYTKSGCLTMNETHGDIIWNPRYIIPRNKDGILSPYENPKVLNLKLSERVGIEEISIKYMFEKLWPQTIAIYMDSIYEELINNCINREVQQQNLYTAKYWNEIGQILGQSKPVKDIDCQLLTLEDILKSEVNV